MMCHIGQAFREKKQEEEEEEEEKVHFCIVLVRKEKSKDYKQTHSK